MGIQSLKIAHCDFAINLYIRAQRNMGLYMARLVMKFGGTSVGDIDRIRNVAQHIKREIDQGHEVCVVVSAMSGTTNQLVEWTRQASPMHDAREYDAVVATGEQVTVGLLSIVLQSIGISARSWLGWQIPIETDNAHGAARIKNINGARLIERMQDGQVCVIAGFQGIAKDGRITTLGRGGSDTSAVAVAAAVKADRCDIYTDVDGVYTTDPRIVPKAQRLDKVSYEEMLEMASLGAKVLQVRSVEMAMKHNVRVAVRSSFDDPAAIPTDENAIIGTLICSEEEIVESQLVSGIAYSKDEAKITLRQVADRPGVSATIFGALSDGNINVDMIVQNISADGKSTDMTFTVPVADHQKALKVIENLKDAIGYHQLDSSSDVVKVSIIGVGMRSHAGVAAQMFKAMAEKNINIVAITTSEIKVSILIDAAYTELAVRTLHTVYGLDKAA
jgi:aspartate kinase